MATPRIVHVITGDSAGAALAEGLRLTPDVPVVVLPDDLACGPLRDLRNLESWRADRLAFWAEVESIYDRDGETSAEAASNEPQGDLLGDPDRMAKADEIVLWAGIGLADQLMVAWTQQALRVLHIGTEKLRLVQFHVNARGTAVSSLTMLSPKEFASAPSRQPVTQREHAYLDEVWSVVTASDPEPLLRLLSQGGPPLPVMHAALQRLLARYPEVRSGVSAFEERLLENTRDRGPNAARIIGQTLADFDDVADSVGDIWLFWRLHRLAARGLHRPAVTLTGRRTALAGTEVRLTEDGRKILAKQLNFVELNGIDDWIGGVHLDSRAGRIWFRTFGTLVRGQQRDDAV
jgi:hypothetical protein